MQLGTQSLKPQASDSDLAVSSVIMSESYIVKRGGGALSQEILFVRKREGKGRDSIVPLMRCFDKKKERKKKEIEQKKKKRKKNSTKASVSPQELLKIQNKRSKGLTWRKMHKGQRQKTEVCPQSR